MCRGLLWQREWDLEEGVVSADETSGHALEPHWLIGNGICVQCVMEKVVFASVVSLVLLGAVYGIAECACWIFGVKASIVLRSMLSVGIIFGLVWYMIRTLRRILSLI